MCPLVGTRERGPSGRVISRDFMHICHRHKSTAVHGLTFLFVTSKHSSVALLSLLFGPVDKCLRFRRRTKHLCHLRSPLFHITACQIPPLWLALSTIENSFEPRFIFFYALLCRCLWNELKCSLPSCHCPTTAGIEAVGDTACIPGPQLSSCLLCLILTAGQTRAQLNVNTYDPACVSLWLCRAPQHTWTLGIIWFLSKMVS